MSRCRTCDDVGITGPTHDRVLCPDCPPDFTDYGYHLTNPRTGTCPLCGSEGQCKCANAY